MKIFVDSANLVEIEEALARGFPAGITTNPSILAKEEKGDFREHIKKIIRLLEKYGYDIPLSVEVFSTRPDERVAQAKDFVRHFKRDHRQKHPPHPRHQRGAPGGGRHRHGAAEVLPSAGFAPEDRRGGLSSSPTSRGG